MSSGAPQRPSGIDRVMRSFTAASSVLPYAVSIQPGPSTLTRMWGATDCASARLKEYTPPFAAQNTSPYPPFIPVSTWSHDMLRITPPGGWVRISSTAFQEASTVPRRSTASSRSSFSTQDRPSRLPPRSPVRMSAPALFTHTSTRPNAPRTPATSASRSRVSVTSACRDSARRPCERTPSAVSSAPRRFARYVRARAAPGAALRRPAWSVPSGCRFDIGTPLPSLHDRQAVRHGAREDIGIQQDDHADDGAQRNGMPEHVPENHALVADLIGRRRGHGDGLRIHHLAHHAARRVGRTHQDGVELELFRGDPLQATEQGVGRGVATRQRHAQPTQIRAEEGKQPTGARECQTEHGIESRIASREPQSQHERNRDDRQLHALQRVPEDLHELDRPHSEDETRDDRGDEAAGPRGREPVEVVPRRLRCQLGHDRSGARHRIVEQGDVPDRRGGPVDGALDGRQSPQEHEDGQDRERHPGLDDLSRGVLTDDRGVRSRLSPWNRGTLLPEPPDLFRPPEPQEGHRRPTK